MRQRPGRVCFGSATPIDPCRGATITAAPQDNAAPPEEKENAEDPLMTDGEIAYLSMVLILFVAFLVIVGYASQTQKKRPDQ
jgi:hypothetical protein